ncbi:ethanol utilization carboxysome structural protein [Gammaproteobacteria bacterium]|nr:ethanol utilization carboxysome structural protein [Gammaproteobacteria bacterium]
MSILEKIQANVTSVRLIASIAPDFKKVLKLASHINSLGIICADSDDIAYIAADEATKQADVEVVFGRSLYAGAAHSPSPSSGEVMIMLGGTNPAEVRAGLDTMIAMIEQGPGFTWADDQKKVAFLAHVISSAGSYLSAQANIAQGSSLAYLIAPPLEATFGIDAALKAASVQLALYIPPPSETNYSGAFLSGDQAACNAACEAFSLSVIDIAAHPIKCG